MLIFNVVIWLLIYDSRRFAFPQVKELAMVEAEIYFHHGISLGKQPNIFWISDYIWVL